MSDKRYEWIASEKIFDVFCAHCGIFLLYAKNESEIPERKSDSAFCNQCLENNSSQLLPPNLRFGMSL
jgi:hypothetical protein